MTSVSKELARMMLDKETFVFRPDSPVQWASGSLMPVYNDNRRLLSYPHARRLVVRGFEEILEQRGLSAQAVVGTATAGIAPAASLADRLALRLYYVRAGVKDHGLGRKIEGADEAGKSQPVVLVEDLVSTGGSSAQAARAVHEAGFRLMLGLAVFSYEFEQAQQRFAALPFSFAVQALVNINLLMECAIERDDMSPTEVDAIQRWIAAPFDWRAS